MQAHLETLWPIIFAIYIKIFWLIQKPVTIAMMTLIIIIFLWGRLWVIVHNLPRWPADNDTWCEVHMATSSSGGHFQPWDRLHRIGTDSIPEPLRAGLHCSTGKASEQAVTCLNYTSANSAVSTVGFNTAFVGFFTNSGTLPSGDGQRDEKNTFWELQCIYKYAITLFVHRWWQIQNRYWNQIPFLSLKKAISI